MNTSWYVAIFTWSHFLSVCKQVHIFKIAFFYGSIRNYVCIFTKQIYFQPFLFIDIDFAMFTQADPWSQGLPWDQSLTSYKGLFCFFPSLSCSRLIHGSYYTAGYSSVAPVNQDILLQGPHTLNCVALCEDTMMDGVTHSVLVIRVI